MMAAMTPANRARLLAWTAVFVLAAAPAGRAEVRPAGLFQEGMVLQREMPVPVWGKAAPGETVTVRFAAQTVTATAGADGRWLTRLKAMPANATPGEMSVSGSSVVTIKNVVVGEVWLASGQSNMELTVGEAADHQAEIAAADLPAVRQFTVKQAGALQPSDEVKGEWIVATPQTAGRFSAVGYFFARELYRTLKIPVGIIHSSYGGSPAEAWVSREAMDAVPELKRVADGQIPRMAAAPAQNAAFPTALPAWEERYGVKDGENEGFKRGWAAPETDTTDWKRVDAGFTWAQALGVKGGGVFWLRKEVDLPESSAGKPFTLAFGNLPEQYHTVYFNGEEVGRMGLTPPDFYSGNRSAKIPGPLVRAGRNAIALRFVSHTEKGGFLALGNALQLPVADRNRVGNEWQIKAEREFPPLSPDALQSQPKANYQKIQYTSTALFNEMLHPLIPFALRGAIWYQGEANVSLNGARDYYRKLLTQMVTDWRGRWLEGNFPFYIVQLTNFGPVDRSHQPNGWPLLRESQTWLSRNLPNAGLAVTIDVGSAVTIHPTNKQDVGKRLAAIALAKNYGKKDVAWQSPVYKDCAVEGNKIRVRFEPGAGALMVGEKKGLEPVREVPDGKLTWFAIAGEDKKFTWAEARIDGESVVVSSAEVPHPVAVRYGWAADPEGCNLYDRAGLPASPFRTDDWP